MNPSRISTPIIKGIDQWWFAIDEHEVCMDISLHRPRDPQAGKQGVPKFHFKASLNTSETKIEGKILGHTEYNRYFPTAYYEADSLSDLRDIVEKGLNEQGGFDWQEVIIIKLGKKTADEHDRTPNTISIDFDFAHVQCAKDKYYRAKLGEYISNSPHHLLDCCNHGGEVHTVPFNDELWNALVEIRARLLGLTDRLAGLLKPEQHQVLTAMMLSNHLLPAATI